MDTTWFAVDSDGAIARFDSGESGAVPNHAASSGGAGEPNFDDWPLRATCAARWLIAQGYHHRPEDRDEHERDEARAIDEQSKRNDRAPTRVLLVYWSTQSMATEGYRGERPSDAAEKRIAERDRVVVSESDPRVVLSLAPVEVDAIDAMRSDASIAAALDEEAVNELWWDSQRAGETGLFSYSHDSRGDGPGAYTRDVAPASVLRVKDLPRATSEALCKMSVAVAFRDCATIQLADHLERSQCTSWSDEPLRIDPNAPPPAPMKPIAPRFDTVVVVSIVVVLAVFAYLVLRAPR